MFVEKQVRETAIVDTTTVYQINDEFFRQCESDGLSVEDIIEEARAQGKCSVKTTKSELVESVQEHESSYCETLYEKPVMRFALHMDGGIIQSVFVEDEHDFEIQMAQFDYDVDGAAPEQVLMIEQSNGKAAPAYVAQIDLSGSYDVDAGSIIDFAFKS